MGWKRKHKQPDWKTQIYKMKESELAQKFIDYFSEGYEIFKEVPGRGIIDIVLRNEDTLTAIEVKNKLSFDVIEQAAGNLPYVNFSYVAVPRPRGMTFAMQVCHKYGIGVLTYENIVFDGGIHEWIAPERHEIVNGFQLELADWMKKSVAGSQNERMTSFKYTIENICRYLERNDGAKLQESLENVIFHWSNITCAKSAVYQWIKKGVIKEFELRDGHLFLTEAGKKLCS